MEKIIYMKNRLDEALINAVITDIEWERVTVRFKITVESADQFDMTEPLAFYLVNGKGEANAKLNVDEFSKTGYSLSLNITNPGYCRCLTPGTYRMRICLGDEVLCAPVPSKDLVRALRNKSTIFMHGNRDKGYSIEFFISDDDKHFEVLLLAQDMQRRNIDSWREGAAPKKSVIKKAINKYKKLKTKKKNKVKRDYYAHCLKKYSEKGEKKTVLFMTEQNEQISRNLKCVKDRMIERGLDSQFNILESARNIVGIGNYGVKNWLEMLDSLARADILFVDDHIPFMDWLKIDEKTTVIQLWHAGAGYKSVGYSRWGREGSPTAFSCHRQYDYGITPSRNIAFFFSEQFGINEEQIIPTGIPRMDSYVDERNKKETRESLMRGLPQINGKKVILFAPTYRGRNRKLAFYPYEKIDFDTLYDFCGNEYVVLFKMHPWVSEPVPIKDTQKDRFIDVNTYANINDLFYITDILITDYSSSVFEFSLMNKPMLFYAFDEHQYEYSRGFHREYRPACPGKICNTFDELIRALREKDYEEYKLDDYIKYHFDIIDSNATDRVIDWFVLDKMPDEFRRAIDSKRRENELLKSLMFSLEY